MAVGVDGGGPVEDVEIEMGEGGVVVELGLEEMEEGFGCERWVFDVGFDEGEEVGVVLGVGESEDWGRW